MTWDKKRVAQGLILLGALAVAFVLMRGWPKDQVLHFSFGDSAARVRELRVRYETPGGGEEPDRGADLRFPSGAPRVVTHEPRLPDGDYVLELSIGTVSRETTITRRAHLESGSTTTLDLSRDVPPDSP